MSLTLGFAPFGARPAGVFNFDRVGPNPVLYWEDFPKRFRVEIGGEVVADSRRVKALHETGPVSSRIVLTSFFWAVGVVGLFRSTQSRNSAPDAVESSR